MDPPSFSTSGPQVVRAAPGSDASLLIPLPSGSPPFHYEWSRAGAKLDSRFRPADDAGGVRLTISSVSTGDSGVYTLQASNAAGKDTTRVRLEVSPDEKPTGDDPPTFLRRLQDLTVKVGTRTRFLVEIVSSTECRVTWYRNERRLLEAERIALVRDGNFWCADISTVSVDDAGRWTCTAENLGGRASCSAHLNVLVPKAYKRPEFVEELRALLTEQGTVSLECKVVGVPTPVLRWFKDSREIKAGDVFALTANAEDPTSLGTYTCEAVNCMGRAYSSSKVHVIGRASREGSARPTSGSLALEPPPIFTKELEDQFVRICEPLTLSCHVVVPPWPRSIVWYNKEGKIEPSEKYRVLEDGVGGYLLEVPSAEWPDEGEWKCVATSSGGRVGITTCYVSMDVPKNYRKPRFMENLQAVLTEEGLVSFECKVVGFPTPVLSWFKDGQELKPGDVYQLTGTNSLGSYCCIARNCMGQASSSAELTVEDIQNQLNEEEKLQLFSKNQAPKFLQGLKSIEAKIDEPFRFTIKVAIPPEPTVLWYRDDQPVDESSRCHHGKEERGVFFLDIQSLEFMDQAEWKCVAMNDYGHSVTSCFLKLIIPRHYKKPRFLENLQAILSDEGAVNLECKVIGVPQPVLKWYKDGEELKPGDIHRIISGQDGTCCLGTYTCEAQNCMGIAASSASLLGFEDSLKSKTKQKVDEQTLQRNLSLSTIHEERTSQMYDTPVGDITLDDKGEISFSFDGKEVSVSLYETPDLTEEEALQIVEMYADQLSENVTEHNVVELPPLRFVKETSTSGNLLMEAIIIDVSPEYFTSPEEDLRTEADVEDISIADENGPPQLSLDQEVVGEDYLEKTMALLADEKADFPKKTDRKKSDSQKSADDYFSLSRDQSLSEEKKDDDSQALSGSDLQSFASARSSGKPKSKSSKPSIEDGQESSDVTKTVLLKEDLNLRQNDEIDYITKSKREQRSRSSRRSSSGSEKSLNKMKEEVLEGNLENTLIRTLEEESTKAEISTISSYLTKLINDIQMIERDIILKSELMSTAATASRSLEIINSLITPLSEIHSIVDAIKESVSESFEVTKSLFNKLPQSLSILHQSLTIIEKCIDLESENKTLVKKTCTNIIEKCGDELNKLVKNISTIVDKDCPFLEDMSISSIKKTNNEILNTISSSVAAIKECKKFLDKMETNSDMVTPELKHLHKTQKAVYELKNPLKSLLYIAEEVDISSFTSTEHVTNSQVILNEMSTPIQALQNALEQIEFLSVAETQSELQKYNTEIMETVMDSVIKLRTSFEQLSAEAGIMENIDVFEKILVDIKHNINEISAQLNIFEAKIGSFDVLHSENKLEALQKMAQILINLENSLVILDIVPCLKINMADFHKNLTKILEHVIESNDVNKYISFLEICDVVNRLNSLIKNMDVNDIFLLAGMSTNLKIIQAIIEKNEFTPQLKLSLITNITDLLLNIHETINHADVSTYSMISENIEDLSIRHFEQGKLNIVLEHIEKAISTISNVVTLETTKDLDIQQAFDKIIPTLGEIKCCIASLNTNVTEQEENISDMSNFTFTQAVAKPLCELNLGISVLNQIICEKSAGCYENELQVELATPLLELRNALEILQQDVISQYGEDVDILNISTSVANAVQSLHSCIIMVQEQDLLENADELSTLEDISAMKTSVDVLSSDYFVSPTVRKITTAIDTPEIAEFETPIVQSAPVKTLRIINDHILMLQKPEFMEIIKALPENAEYSFIKSFTEKIDTVHNAIEGILHPIALEESQNESNFIYSTHLLTILQPLQELKEHLSVIDISNIPESALQMDQKNSLSQCLSKFETCLRDSIDYIHVSIETADVALDISAQIETLRKLCIDLKNTTYNTIDESSELIMLRDSVTTALDAISCPQEINITRVKHSLQRLHQSITTVKDELFGFGVQNHTILHNETRNLKSIEEIEKAIASLAQLQFVDLNLDSDFDYYACQQEGKEIKYEPIIKMKEIVETVENCTRRLSFFMPNSNDLSTKDFVEIFNDEITLLNCLFNQKPTPKRLIKMLQVFYDLCKTLEKFQLQEKPYTSKDFSEQMDILEECFKKVQTILLEVLNSQSHLVFETPISNIINSEMILNELLESNETAYLHNFVKLLMNTIELIKPWFENLQADVGKELESCNVNLNKEEDADKHFALLQNYLSEKTENNDINVVRDIFKEILRMIQKHEDCKHVRGNAKKMILIKFVSDCLNILKQVLIDKNERDLTDGCTLDLHNLEKFLIQLSEPIEIFHKKIVKICNENLQNISQSLILKELQLFESQVKAISKTKIAEKLLKCENLPINTLTDNSIINLAKESVIKIYSIQKELQNLESAYSIDISMNIEHIKEIEKILTTLLPVEDIGAENRQLKQKADSLIQHMEQYIEIIEIVEEVSAVIRLDDLKKSADIVRELHESITSEKSPDINVASPELSITGEQIQLVQNLQKALTTLQIEPFECEQQLRPDINDDIRQQIIEKVSELQHDLVALTSNYVVLENFEPLESIEQMDENSRISIQEDVAGPENVIENKEYAVHDSQENHKQPLNVTKSDLVAQCDFTEMLQTEGSRPETEISATPTPDIYDEKQSLELMSEVKLSDSKILELSMMKIDSVKESVIKHINDYICQDIIDDIKKILPSTNFEQLEHSLQIAVEVRDNAVLEDSCPLAQQVFLEKQLESILKLQEAMLATYPQNLNDTDDETLQSHIGQDRLKRATSVVHNLLNSIQIYVISLNTIIQGEGVVVETCKENLQNATKSEINICDINNSINDDLPVGVLNEGQEISQENNNSDIFGEENNYTDISKTKVMENQQVSEEFKKERTPTEEVVMEETKLDEKYLTATLTESEKSLDSETQNALTIIENITEMNITDSVQEEITENNKTQKECKINDTELLTEVNNMLMDNNILIVTDSITSVQDDNIILVREVTNVDEEISHSILQLETLLHEVNETLNLFENCPEVQNSEKIQDILEEVQTVIMKLKYNFDGSMNDILNENIEDLECNVRSLQLQINENSPPALLKEACANLQTLAAYMKNIYVSQNIKTTNNVLCICTNDAEQAIELLDKASSFKVDCHFDNIILNLGVMKDTMKSLKSFFLNDADTLILRGIEVLQNLDTVEDKVFALEKDLDVIENIDITFRDSIIAAIHSIYGSISNMRGTICSIQKKYMYDNYGQPSDNFLKSIKNVSFILNYDKKEDWKQFAKSLRKMLKHFEDVKFYINFDKTARLPSDSAFTKIILHELTTVLSGVVLENTKELDKNLTTRVEDALNYISEILKNMEDKPTVEVKEKIPIFKELSIKIFDLTDSIRVLIKKNMDNINQSSIDIKGLSKDEENLPKIMPDNGDNDENEVQKTIQSENTNVATSVVQNINEFVEDSSGIIQDENKNAVHEQLQEFKKEENIEASDIQMMMVELEEINSHENKDKEADKNQQENGMSSFESVNKNIVAIQRVDQQELQERNNLNENIVHQDIEIKVRENNKSTVNDDLDSIEARIEDQYEVEDIKVLDPKIDEVKNISDDSNLSINQGEMEIDMSRNDIINVPDENRLKEDSILIDQDKISKKDSFEKDTESEITQSEIAKSKRIKVEENISIHSNQYENNLIAQKEQEKLENNAVDIRLENIDDKMKTENQKNALETEEVIERTNEDINSDQTKEYPGIDLSLDQHKNEIQNQLDIITRQPSDTKQEDIFENQKKIENECENLNKQQTSNSKIEADFSFTTEDNVAINIQIEKHDTLSQQNDQEVSKIIEKAQQSESSLDKMETENQTTLLEKEKGVERTTEEIRSDQTEEYQGIKLTFDQHETGIENKFDIILQLPSDIKQEDTIEKEKKIEEENKNQNTQQISNNEIEANISLTTKIDKHDTLSQKIYEEVGQITEKEQVSQSCHEDMKTENQKPVLETKKGAEKIDEEKSSVCTNEYERANLSLDLHRREVENQFDLIQQHSETKQDVIENNKIMDEASESRNNLQTSNNEIEVDVAFTTKDKVAISIQIDKQQNDTEVGQMIKKAQESEVGHLEEVLTSLESNCVLPESVNIEEAKEDKFYSTIIQSHVIEDSQNKHDDSEKQQKYDEIIPLVFDTQVQHTELKDSNMDTIQKDEKEKKDSPIELVKVEKKDDSVQKIEKLLLSEQMVDIENVKVTDMKEAQTVEITKLTDHRSKTDMKDDFIKDASDDKIDVFPPKSIHLEIINNKEEDSLSNLLKEEIQKLDINDKKRSKHEETKKETLLEKDRDEDSAKDRQTFQEDISIKCDKTTISTSSEESINKIQKEECDVLDKTGPSDIITGQTEKPISVQTAKMLEIAQDAEEENKIISKKPAEVGSDNIENIQQCTEKLANNTKDIDIEVLKERDQKGINEFQQDLKDDVTERSEIKKDVYESQDVLDKNIKEVIKKVDKDAVKDKDTLSLEKLGSTQEQEKEIVPASKEYFNVDGSLNKTEAKPQSAQSEIIHLSEELNAEMIAKDEENENEDIRIQSHKEPQKSKTEILVEKLEYNKEEDQEEQFKQKDSKPIKKNEKDLQDETTETESKLKGVELEEIQLKQHMKKLDLEKPFDEELNKNVILSVKSTESIESTLIGKQNDTTNVEIESENKCGGDFKNKIGDIETKLKSEIGDTLENEALHKETDNKASTDVDQEKKDFVALKQNIQKEQDQQEVTLGKTESASNLDSKFDKIDEKPKTKLKKTIKVKTKEKKSLKKQEEAKAINQETQQKIITEEDSIKKEKVIEINNYSEEIKIEEENENNVKATSIEGLEKQLLDQGDKSDEQKDLHLPIPGKMLQQEQVTDIIVVKQGSERIEEREVAISILQSNQQQTKLEEDEALEIVHKEATHTLDGKKIEKKGIDSNENNQVAMKTENILMPEKQLGEIPIIEANVLNIQSKVQKEEKQNGSSENDQIKQTILEPSIGENKIIEQKKNGKKSKKLFSKQEDIPTIPSDSQIQQKTVDTVHKNGATKKTVHEGYEILKSDDLFGDKDTCLKDKEAKELQKTENVITEFQLDMKETLSKDFSLHDKSACSDDSLDIQESNILSRNEIKVDPKTSKYKDIKQRPLFTDRNKPDYEQEFARPPGYSPKTFDVEDSQMEFKATSKSPTIYRAQTLVQESQLKNSLPPHIDQRSNLSEGRSDLKPRFSSTSESRSTASEKRGSFMRDFKRKPVFSTHLTDRTAVESSRVKLTCSVLSSTEPVISWYKNGVLLDNKHKCRTKYVDGLITLEILNAVPSDSGEYSCSVENENGSVTSSANLKVYPGFEASPIPPTFTRSIRDVYHLHENELVLECRIRGQPLPTITWLKDNRPIILNERYQAHYLADGVCRLTIVSPNEDDSGKYTCKAENSMWSDQITHEVYFSSKESRYIKNIATPESIRINRQVTESRRPHFTNVLSDHKVVSGGTIGLQVEISGSPTRVEWLREGQSVTEIYRNAQTYIDHGLYTLALSDVTEKESGQYTCRAWSSHGTVDMNASITVVQPNQFEGKPARIISRPVKDLLISVGEDLNISFRVQGEPKPKVFLMKGIRDISNSQRVCKMTSDDYVKFTLKRSVISDAGTYCVFVRNAYGCDRAFVTVVIRQRASSDHLISDWTYPMDDLAISVVDRNYQSVPDKIPSEPTTVDGGNNWVSLAWPKPESQVKAPILAYKVESWLLGKEGGARWLELGITPRNCFDVFNLKQGEEYHFRVTPRNRYGWGESVQTSTPIGIGLAGDRPEFIEILPGQLKVLVGEKATLCCSFKGNPMPEIVWMKNGHELEEETERVRVQLNGNNTSLYINEIKIEDEGRYSCEATNIHGRSSTYSRMAVITDRQIWEADAKLKRERSAGANGEYPPQFTMRLRDRRVQATYPVRLTCQVIGSPSPTVTWFKNGEEVPADSRHTTSQDEYFYTLEIAPTTLDDGGLYEAMARNGCGAISCRCNLVVDKGIRAYIAPEFCCGFEPLYRVCEGDELRISAVVEAYPSVGVTWYRDGVRLRPSRRAVMTLDRDGQIELALASVAPRDAGVYTCTASNEVGKASTSGKVEVVKGEHTSETPKVPPIVISPDLPYSKEPMFIRKPRSSEAHEGDTVIIECEVIGDPKPDVYWLRDFLKPDYYRDASHFKRVGAGPAYRFEIPHAKFDYTGAYSIVAKNIHGEAKAIISLQILAKDPTSGDDTHNIRYGRVEVIPRFDKELTDLLCYDGDAIEFECRVSGNPEPDIRWFHYTEVLPECPDFETCYNLGTARLKINQVTAEDEGTYTCEASNNLGKATSSACLVIYPPGEPNTLSQRLRRPPALLSASSTPRSTPRTTPARSLSRTPGPDFRRLHSPSREIAPKFYTYPYNRVVEEGDTVVFQCAVRGLPPPWATWDKDGIIITPTARISIREKDDMFRILEIEQVTIEDVGLYRVTLENDYGRAEASARLEVISQTGKFYGSRSYSVSPRKCLPYRRRTPSLTRQD